MKICLSVIKSCISPTKIEYIWPKNCKSPENTYDTLNTNLNSNTCGLTSRNNIAFSNQPLKNFSLIYDSYFLNKMNLTENVLMVYKVPIPNIWSKTSDYYRTLNASVISSEQKTSFNKETRLGLLRPTYVVCGKVIFSDVSACLSRGSHALMAVILSTGGVYSSMHLGRHPPRTDTPGKHPPQADTPWGRHPLPTSPPSVMRIGSAAGCGEVCHPLGRHPPRQTSPRQTPPWQTATAVVGTFLLSCYDVHFRLQWRMEGEGR